MRDKFYDQELAIFQQKIPFLLKESLKKYLAQLYFDVYKEESSKFIALSITGLQRHYNLEHAKDAGIYSIEKLLPENDNNFLNNVRNRCNNRGCTLPSEEVLLKGFSYVNFNTAEIIVDERLKYEENKNNFYLKYFNLNDIAANLKILMLLFPAIESDHKKRDVDLLAKFCLKCQIKKDVLLNERTTIDIVKSLITYRNHFDGHSNLANYKKDLNANTIKNICNCTIELVNLTKNGLDKQNQDLVTDIFNLCTELKNEVELNYLPYQFTQVKNDNSNLNVTDEIIIDLYKPDSCIDEIYKQIYFTTKQYVTNLLQRKLKYIHAIELYENEKSSKQITQEINNVISTQEDFKKPILNELYKLAYSTQTGSISLSDKQQQEIFNNTVILIDRSLLLNNMSKVRTGFHKYLAETLAPNNIKPYVLFQTRIEIYREEKNASNSDELREIAKHTRTRLDGWHESKLIGFLKNSTKTVSTYDELVYELAQKYPNNDFVILQESLAIKDNNELLEKISTAQVKNVLPVQFSYQTNELKLNTKCRRLLPSFCNVEKENDAINSNDSDSNNSDDENNNDNKSNSNSNNDNSNLKEDVKTNNTIQKEVVEKEQVESKIVNQQITIKNDTEQRREFNTSISSDKNKNKQENNNQVQKKTKIEKNKVYELKIEDKKLLDVDLIPKEKNTVLVIENNEYIKYVLEEKISEGGEAIVYRNGNKAFKIYRKEMITEFRYNKLQELLDIENIKHVYLPIALVYNIKKQFVGYMMNLVPTNYKTLNRNVLQLADKNIAKETMSNWNRLSLVKTCYQLVKLVKNAHLHNIIIGDFNEKNIMASDNGENPIIELIDCDSFQYHGYPCPVGWPEMTNPQLYIRQKTNQLKFGTFLRTKEDDLYSLAILLFRILMLNNSPFLGKSSGVDLLEEMRNYNFPFPTKDNRSVRKDTPDGPAYLIWNNTPSYVKEKFDSVFRLKQFVTEDEWLKAFKYYMRDIEQEKWSNELQPTLYHDNKNKDLTTYFTCKDCGRTANLPNDRYKYYQENNIYLKDFCLSCSQKIQRLKNTKISSKMDSKISRAYKCLYCNQTYYFDDYKEAYLFNLYGQKKRCPNCRKEYDEIKRKINARK